MKKLLIYKHENDFVIERVNEFKHSFKRLYGSLDALKEGLDSYPLEDYQLEVSDDLWNIVINYINN